MSIPKPLVKVGIGCLVVLLTCFGGMGIWAWRVLGGTVKPTTDYAAEINALVEAEQKGVADQPDAWQDVLKLLDRSKSVHDAAKAARSGEYVDLLPDPTVLRSSAGFAADSPDLKPENLAAARKLLDDLRDQKVFADLDALAPRMHAVRKLNANGGMLIEILLPDLATSRQLARANAARYHLAVIAGNDAEAVRAFESGLALGRIFMQQGILIDRLVGQAIMTLQTTAMLETVDQIKDVETLKSLMAALERQTKVPSVTLSVETERRSVLDTIQWTFTDLGNGNGYLSPQRMATVQVLSGSQIPGEQVFLGVLTADRQDTTNTVNRYFDEVVKWAALPRVERVKGAFQPDVEVENLSLRYVMLKILLPAFGSAINADDRRMMDVAGVKTVLGVELWRRNEAGRVPEELAALVPGVLGELPLDAFTGKPFGYRVLAPGGDDSGPRYLLYSFGSDGVDDGGVEMPDGPGETGNRYRVLYRQPAQPGFDFVVYPVRK
jgi:hypothetical protein